MRDAIYRQDALEVFNKPQELNYGFYYAEKIKDLPSANLEIIRCNECKWYNEDVIHTVRCRCKDGEVDRGLVTCGPNDYCSYAEKRE